MKKATQCLAVLMAAWISFTVGEAHSQSQNQRLKIVITEGVIEPLPIAVPEFVAENAGASDHARRISNVIAADLAGTGLFRVIPRDAYISQPQAFDSPVRFADWKAINAQALVHGSVRRDKTKLEVRFRLFDVFSETPFGKGVQFGGGEQSWRRIAHKIADVVYQGITGEKPYFDSRIAFVSESGPKGNRSKRLALMDYDGANVINLTDGEFIVLAPRFSPNGDLLIYTTYETGVPKVQLLDLRTGDSQAILESAEMTFAPRFSPEGGRVLLSLTRGANTDIFEVEIGSRRVRRMTDSAAIDTAPSYSPDGKWIAFESDRSQRQQIYVMRSDELKPRRISFGEGRYGPPVWSPTGDYIAFTKQTGGRFHIGVMRADGSGERLLTASFLDEGPTWSPNGRVLMFFREAPGAAGGPSLYSVDVYGRVLKRVPTPQYGSDPAWSPLRK